MEIETRNCSLDTMAVTIQALHVSGKQMTLAVFRQLPDWKAGSGIPANIENWGVVRYSIGGTGKWRVFSYAGKLYRCRLEPKSDRDFSSELWRAEEYLKRYPNKEQALMDVAECKDALEEEKERAKIDQKFLDTLPQLFIAV